MAARSDLVFLYLALVSIGTLASDCERNNVSSVVQTSNCLSCPGCYKLVESYYNTTLEARANFSTFYERFLNLSQLNVSQLVDRYHVMLTLYRNVAVETAKNEQNITSELRLIANGTARVNELSEMLKRNLSLVMNGSRDASVTHSNNVAILMELDMLVNAIRDTISRNISVLSHRAEAIYNQTLAKLEQLAGIAENASDVSSQQEDLAMDTNSAAQVALNLSSMSLENLCEAIEIHDVSGDLIDQLSSQNVFNLTASQLRVELLVMLIQETIQDVLNTSQQLVEKAANVSLLSYDVDSLGSLVSDAVQNVTELIFNVNTSSGELQSLEQQAITLNDTIEGLLRASKELEQQAYELLMLSNESFTRAKQSVNMARPYIDDITKLHVDVTTASQSFNENFADVTASLGEAENITEIAYNLTVKGQEDLKEIQLSLNTTTRSLDNASRQITDVNGTLHEVLDRTEIDTSGVRSQSRVAVSLITSSEETRNVILNLNETGVNQSAQLRVINSTSLTVQGSLDIAEQQLQLVRGDLESLMGRLHSVQLSDADIEEVRLTITMATEVVEQNENLLVTVMSKMDRLGSLSDALEKKYKQLKQHRDLLQKILDNIGDYSCNPRLMINP